MRTCDDYNPAFDAVRVLKKLFVSDMGHGVGGNGERYQMFAFLRDQGCESPNPGTRLNQLKCFFVWFIAGSVS